MSRRIRGERRKELRTNDDFESVGAAAERAQQSQWCRGGGHSVAPGYARGELQRREQEQAAMQPTECHDCDRLWRLRTLGLSKKNHHQQRQKEESRWKLDGSRAR